MIKKKIKFGYETKTGDEIELGLAHTVITGLTQASGKTTSIMGLIKRSGLKAIIIKTKIGEKAISEGAIIPPFYKEDFDWEYASELLESSRKEKLKFERSWIIKYSKSASNLLEFKKNIDEALMNSKIRELEKSVLISLQAYLEKILPELQYAPLSKTLDIKEGISIMDLERFKEETQSLIIRSVLNEVLTKEKNTLVVIPEVWRYVPEKHTSPVKKAAEIFIRQGATNNNYLFLDSQDITGTSKAILKQISNWVLGKQTEINEIKRVLDQIPLPKKSKPKPEEVATLKLGHFFVVTSDFTKQAYAQPSWLDNKTAKKVAMGKISVDTVEQPTQIAPYQVVVKEQFEKSDEGIQSSQDFMKKLNELREDFISNRNDFFNKFEQINSTISDIYAKFLQFQQEKSGINEDEIIMRVLQKVPVSSGSSSFDKEGIIKEVLSRVPKGVGGVTYEVSPLDKIKKDFLNEAKEKLLNDLKGVSDNAKKVLKYLESKSKGVKSLEIEEKCFLMKHSGGSAKKVSDTSLELRAIEVSRKDKAGWHYGELKKRIIDLLGNQGASQEEINQIYDHILYELL